MAPPVVSAGRTMGLVSGLYHGFKMHLPMFAPLNHCEIFIGPHSGPYVLPFSTSRAFQIDSST